MKHIDIVEADNAYLFYLKFDDDYAPELFTLVVRENELMFLGEDGIEFWFVEKSESGVLKFIKTVEKEVGEKHT